MISLPFAAEELVPHRLPMLLIDRLVSVEGKNGVAEALIREDCPLVGEAGDLENVVLVELIAQSYAALKGYLDRQDEKPVRQGFLVGIKKFVALEPVVTGDLLRIDVETIAELDDFAIAQGQIWNADTMVGRGEIKIWIQ